MSTYIEVAYDDAVPTELLHRGYKRIIVMRGLHRGTDIDRFKEVMAREGFKIREGRIKDLRHVLATKRIGKVEIAIDCDSNEFGFVVVDFVDMLPAIPRNIEVPTKIDNVSLIPIDVSPSEEVEGVKMFIRKVQQTRTKRRLEALIASEIKTLINQGYLPKEYEKSFPYLYSKVVFETSVPMASTDIDKIVENKSIFQYIENEKNKLTVAYNKVLEEMESRIKNWMPFQYHSIVTPESLVFERRVILNKVTVADDLLADYINKLVTVEVIDKKSGKMLCEKRIRVNESKSMWGEPRGFIEINVANDYRCHGREVIIKVKP